jgi:hypothetical protein
MNETKKKLHKLEKDLLAAVNGPRIELTVAEIRQKGLIKALRERGFNAPRPQPPFSPQSS